jgi:hypothetical protein
LCCGDVANGGSMRLMRLMMNDHDDGVMVIILYPSSRDLFLVVDLGLNSAARILKSIHHFSKNILSNKKV